MTFPDYLAELEGHNRRLFDAREIKLTPDSLREQLRRAYQAGAEEVAGSQSFNKLFPPLPQRGGMDRE